MARRIDKSVPKHLRNAVQLEQELALIEKEDMMLQHPTFLGNQRQFIDRIYQHLPEVADKLVKFMTANPERVYGSNGTVQLMLPEDVAMTDGQLQLFKLILQKGLPNQAPVTMSGEQNQFGSGKVAITINQTLSLIHISEPTRPERISYAVFCLKNSDYFFIFIIMWTGV